MDQVQGWENPPTNDRCSNHWVTSPVTRSIRQWMQTCTFMQLKSSLTYYCTWPACRMVSSELGHCRIYNTRSVYRCTVGVCVCCECWRRAMIERIASHVGDFTPRLQSNTRALYQYCPIPVIVFPQLETELFCNIYYLRHLCDTMRFPDWPIRDPVCSALNFGGIFAVFWSFFCVVLLTSFPLLLRTAFALWIVHSSWRQVYVY